MQEQMPQGEQAPQGEDPMKQMIMMVDQAMGQLAEALGSEQLAQVQAQFRSAIEQALQGGGQQQARPSQMQDPMAQGAKVSQAY